MKKPYYYIKVIEICPLCGKEIQYKYREYGKKPKKREDRVIQTYMTYHCGV